MPWRQLGVLALLLILIAGALAAYVGSQQPTRLPTPFGPAANGLVAFETGGDIQLVDPATSAVRSIVAGQDVDTGPRFSRDGTRVVFTRGAGDQARLYVAAVDGTDVTPIIPSGVRLTPSILGEPWEQYQFSPDGRSIVIASIESGVPGISIANSDGSGVRRLDVGMPAYEPSFRPTDGRELMFLSDTGAGVGIFAFDLATDKVRTIVKHLPEYGVAGPNWSPDGSQIAYWRWGGVASVDLNARARIVAADGSSDRELPAPGDAVWNAGSEWSNDGTRIVVVRGYSGDFGNVRVVLAPADGSSTGMELPVESVLNADCCAAFEWSPDDASILVSPIGAGQRPLPQVIVDVATGTVRPAPWGSTSDPTWQRVAS
jgi:Tol biopolymer transport system component